MLAINIFANINVRLYYGVDLRNYWIRTLTRLAQNAIIKPRISNPPYSTRTCNSNNSEYVALVATTSTKVLGGHQVPTDCRL